MFSEPAVICHNIFLVAEALGVGRWMHCGILSREVMQAMGFAMIDPVGASSCANPVGLDGILEGYCPRYYPSMDAAVDAVAACLSRKDAAPPAAASWWTRGLCHPGGGVPSRSRRDQR